MVNFFTNKNKYLKTKIPQYIMQSEIFPLYNYILKIGSLENYELFCVLYRIQLTFILFYLYD